MKNRMWIAWERHRRNEGVSRNIKAELFQLETRRTGLFRYLSLIPPTMVLIVSRRPAVLFAQNPSMVLSLLVLVIGKAVRKPVVIDAHNMGVLFENRNRLLLRLGQRVNQFIIKHARLTIVTNETLARRVKSFGGRSFVLPDPIPRLEKMEPKVLAGSKKIFYICSFGGDEPFLEVVEAAKELDHSVVIYISGDFRKAILVANPPKNVVFTGYLSEEEYLGYLFSCDVVIDLTRRENCLVCGAYEALAAEKPMILSDTSALREYFGEGAAFCGNNARDISQAVKRILKKLPESTSRVVSMKRKKMVEWERSGQGLSAIICAMESRG